MKVSMWNKLLYLIAGVVAGIIASMLCNSAGCSRINEPTIIRDTIITLRFDTIRIERPQPYKIVVRDTVEVNMPRNDDAQLPPSVGEWLYAETTYKAEQYTAVVEGIGAYLKSIEVYPRTELRTITTTMPVVFQSTPPRGERLSRLRDIADALTVSIHAPTWGATSCNSTAE